MARTRSFLSRPHDSLHAAAAKHAAIVAGEPYPSEELEQDAGAKQTDTERKARRRQAHDSKGRFA